MNFPTLTSCNFAFQKNNKSFEEIILKKQNSSSEPTAKKPKVKVCLKARAVTNEQF